MKKIYVVMYEDGSPACAFSSQETANQFCYDYNIKHYPDEDFETDEDFDGAWSECQIMGYAELDIIK